MNANGNDPGLTAKAATPLAAELVWEVEGLGQSSDCLRALRTIC